MADPGTLIPFDGLGTRVEYEESFSTPDLLSSEADSSAVDTSNSGAINSFDEPSANEALHCESTSTRQPDSGDGGDEDLRTDLLSCDPPKVEKLQVEEFPRRSSYLLSHIRSPSWTEGVSPPILGKMKVNDVSQIVIDAAKGNPQFAKKLHDALLETGVIGPPPDLSAETKHRLEIKERNRNKNESEFESSEHQPEPSHPHLLPPLPPRGGAHKTSSLLQLEHQKPVESSGEAAADSVSSQSDVTPAKFGNVPVAAAAAAAAAVVASSVVAAVAKSSADSNIELPMAAAATAAAVVATTAAVGKQYENPEASQSPTGDVDSAGLQPQGSDQKESDGLGAKSGGERTSDRSAGTDSGRSEVPLDDVADCEIPLEEITLGERIGLGTEPLSCETSDIESSIGCFNI